ncbi:hypothetical protein SRB5_46690 [Streptomyces sp. RB5]|uniref:TIGR02680 family protein n=1 Tax=Streptomyces smaragdinus TaxID=2585196 RepID=A0A7K0CM55_9ACTN|nr:TIGR02680 family protein [Streptomyces smaragdinus]MQY14501.1 hypothetical protein [Streptomyces smaragdinus]
MTPVPPPRDPYTERWRPERAGVLNVWRYYDEVFGFHRGRLLLRGPNGSGKSKALEVLLPFLFDASLKPGRLSTFGGNERTMHWNLMGEGATGVTRVGYVWLEFSRLTADGTEWFTLGARLQATSRTTSVGAVFFTVRARIGRDEGPALVNEAGQPLTVAALKEAVAGRGEVYDSASDYRAVVRQTLFPGLSEQRYDALITALLQLRTPKLSERLDPSLLSTLLSKALPPLDRDEVSELADGFERLDRQRVELSRMDERAEAADRLAARQRSYARRVLRARAAGLISATTEMDNLTRVARETEEAHERALADRTTAQRELAADEELQEELGRRIDVLTGSPEYRQGTELDRLRERAARAREAADRLHGDWETAQADAEEAEHRAGQARLEAEAQAGRAREAEEEAGQAARAAGLGTVAAEAAAVLAEGAQERARQLLDGAVRARLDQIAGVRAAAAGHRQAVNARETAEQARDQARSALGAATARQEEEAVRYREAVGARAGLLRDWARSCAELRFADADIEELADFADQEAEVLALIGRAAHATERELTAAETTVRRHLEDLHRERTEAAAEAERLRLDRDLPPQPPRTRSGDRTGRPGAPLWKLIAFHDAVPAGEQAAVEAALEASGLLDAWLSPDGTLAAAGHDTFAAPDWAPAPAAGRGLAAVLRPEADAAVPGERVERLLASIAYGPTLPAGPAAVGADGSWRLAAATGTWSKPESAHIGAAARERARHRRIAELGARIEELDVSIGACDSELALLDGRRRTLDLERRGCPPYAPVATAQRTLDRAEAEAAARADTHRVAAALLTEREQDVAVALRDLHAVAAEHQLPADDEALGRLAGRCESLREAAGRWLLAAVQSAALLRAADAADEQAARAGRSAADHEAKARTAGREAAALAAAVQEAERTVGAPYQELLARIGELRTQVGVARKAAEQHNISLRELAARIGQLGERRTTASGQRDDAVAHRDEAAGRLRACMAAGFAEDASAAELRLPADARVTATLEAARTIAARWPSVPHEAKNIAEALERLAETRYATAQTLQERADIHLEAEDDLHVLSASIDGARLGAAGLLTALREERDRAQDDITTRERGLFDRILTGDTRRHLASRIRQANALVDAMNSRLERVRTASKVAVQLLWQVDPELPPGTRAARDLLLKDPVRLTDADQEALHQFFRERIEEARADQRAVSWEEQLAQVLDYTAWHRFTVRLDRANGQGWQLLTKKLHGALSGGEKAIALHLPLFAAVAAHYHSVPDAPRLILLDEVFVGVDAANRGQVFALLSSLDLDLLLTSDHEWCTYRELDGIAVHQLLVDDLDDAVTTARFVWNGSGLLSAEGAPLPPDDTRTPAPGGTW